MPRRPFGRLESFRRAAGATTPSANVKGAKAIGSFIRLAAVDAKTADGFVVLAYEVAMKRTGVTLTRADFESCVENFNVYAACPVTIEHADTEDGPTQWAEPHGHIEALRVGTTTRTVDGAEKTVATLEGRPSYLEATAKDVAAGKWRFGSITMLKNVVDEESGAKRGCVLWSWSLTAHPRLKDLASMRLTAARRVDGELIEAGYWDGSIEDRDDLVACLREILDLPVTTTEAEVLAELTKLEELAAAEDTRGVDVECLVDRLRSALRLPALTTTEGVLAEVRKGLANLPADEASGADGETSMSRRPPAATTRPAQEIHPMKLVALLATFGLSVPTEEEAQPRVVAFAQLGADALKAVGLPTTATPAEFSARLSALSTDAARTKALETEVATFRSQAAEAEKAEREKHFAELFTARPDLKPAEGSLRMHAERDFEGFAKAYPRPSAEQLLASAQHGARLEQVTGAPNPGASTVALGGATQSGAADAIVSMVHSHIALRAGMGVELTFAQAFAEIAG